jgi:hypothetical protein
MGACRTPARLEQMNPKTLKLIALGYVVKTALVGLAWLAIPDLPERAVAMARETWSRVTAETPGR